jgi:hypothetical protein
VAAALAEFSPGFSM